MLRVGRPQVWTGPGGNPAPFRMVRAFLSQGSSGNSRVSPSAYWAWLCALGDGNKLHKKGFKEGGGVWSPQLRHVRRAQFPRSCQDCSGWQREAGIPQASAVTVPA